MRRILKSWPPILSLCGCLSAQAAVAPEYPRTVQADGMTLRIHHPVVDRWTDPGRVEGWVPVEVSAADTGKTWVGAVRARADMQMDLEQRVVTLSGQTVLETRFSEPAVPERVTALAARAVSSRPREVLLDELLQALAEPVPAPGVGGDDPGFNPQPPRIVVSETPLQLLAIDGEPVRAPAEGTGIEVVVNTNWPLFHHAPSATWYVLNQGAWQRNSLLASGGWTTTTELPEGFSSLVAGGAFPQVAEALPPRAPSQDPVPFVVTLEPTELIVLDGPPRLQAVPGAGDLAVTANTQRDLFRLDGRWFFLTAGRWFTADDLDGDWAPVKTLPRAFSDIPADHGRAHVRAAVPGTAEATMAYLEATLPQVRTVAADATPQREVFYVGEPRFEPIPGTTVAKAVNTPAAVLRVGSAFYLNEEAAWFRADSPGGPWRVAREVPEALYAIPPDDPLYPVTAVRPLATETGDGGARFTYTEAYNGMYTIGRRAVRGTGYRYPPYVSWVGPSPVLWGYPHTYGWGYPWRPPYAPYWGAYAPPQTWVFDGSSRDVGAPAAPSERDPRGTRRGYDYTTLTQQRAADAAAANPAGDDLYADPQGQVYRRDPGGWSRHQDGEWSTMAELERQYGVEGPRLGAPDDVQRQAYRQNPEDVERMERYYERRARSYNVHSTIYVGR